MSSCIGIHAAQLSKTTSSVSVIFDEDKQKQQRIAAAALRRQSLLKRDAGFLKPSGFKDISAGDHSTINDNDEPSDAPPDEALADDTILSVPQSPLNAQRRMSTATEIRIANFKNQNKVVSTYAPSSGTHDAPMNKSDSVDYEKSNSNQNVSSIEDTTSPDGLSPEEIQYLKEQHEKWKILDRKPLQISSSGDKKGNVPTPSVLYRLFYEVGAEIPPLSFATIVDEKTTESPPSQPASILVPGTLGSELIKLIEETNKSKMSDAPSKSNDPVKKTWKKKPSMLIDRNNLNPPMNDGDSDAVSESESWDSSDDELFGDSICSDETMDEEVYLSLVASLPDIDTKQEEYWELKTKVIFFYLTSYKYYMRISIFIVVERRFEHCR